MNKASKSAAAMMVVAGGLATALPPLAVAGAGTAMAASACSAHMKKAKKMKMKAGCCAAKCGSMAKSGSKKQ